LFVISSLVGFVFNWRYLPIGGGGGGAPLLPCESAPPAQQVAASLDRPAGSPPARPLSPPPRPLARPLACQANGSAGRLAGQR